MKKSKENIYRKPTALKSVVVGEKPSSVAKKHTKKATPSNNTSSKAPNKSKAPSSKTISNSTTSKTISEATDREDNEDDEIEYKETEKQKKLRLEALGILDWLEIDNNFKLITGSVAYSSKVTAGQKLTKMDGYRKLGKDLAHVFGEELSGEQAKGRFGRLLDKYKKALELRDKKT
ncbi:hypothetical protein HDV05_002439, partial [Chytridiales sp. JEL 0842]